MPIIFFLMLTGFINTFQAFNSIFVMQTSSAGDTMDVVTIEIFDHFWGRVNMVMQLQKALYYLLY